MRLPSTSAYRLDFRSDVAEFLEIAGSFLAAAPVTSTVIAEVAQRAVAQAAQGVAQPAGDWWLSVVDDAGAVVGAGMRTAPFEPRPLFLLAMPDEAAVALARELHARGESVSAINGALRAVKICAEELGRCTDRQVRVAQHTRLFELGELVPPAPASGRLVAATERDAALVTEWFGAFLGDADEQAGRPRGESPDDEPDPAVILHRIREEHFWLWIDESGAPVHLTGIRPPAYGVTRVGPVYTPPAQRRRGWASNAVAEVARQQQAKGVRVSLFTDQANPTSNSIYAALGFQPVVDMANLVVE